MAITSFDTQFFINKWNKADSSDARVRLLKNYLTSLYFNKDLIEFLEEFTSQAISFEKRIYLLLLCRKIILQYPKVIDQEHYRAFQEIYDYERYTGSKVEPIQWIEDEVWFLREVKSVGEDFELFNQNKTTPDNALDKHYPQGKELMTLEETLSFLSVSKSTIDRWREDGLQNLKAGKKIYFNRNEIMNWIQNEKPSKVQLSIKKKRKEK